MHDLATQASNGDFLLTLQATSVYLAQQVQQPDLWTRVQYAWTTFVESGQIWALLIGLFVGYWFKGMTG